MSREFLVSADDDGIRLDRWVSRHLPGTSFNQVSRWARTGQIRLDGARVAPGDRVVAGQTLRMPPAEAPRIMAVTVPKPERPKVLLSDDEIAFAQSLVIHKSQHAIVINKPPGLATQGGSGVDVHVDGLLDALTFDERSRPKLVHRLDKDTVECCCWRAPAGRRRFSGNALRRGKRGRFTGRWWPACRRCAMR